MFLLQPYKAKQPRCFFLQGSIRTKLNDMSLKTLLQKAKLPKMLSTLLYTLIYGDFEHFYHDKLKAFR